MKHPVWLFDLDNTLHDASHAAFGEMHVAIGDYVAEFVGITGEEAQRLRERYWLRYGATLLGLVRHHGVPAAHFLAETHRMPGLEARVRTSAHDRAVLRRLPGKKVILTNAPRAYAMRVLDTLGLTKSFAEIVTIEDMTMFGSLRPKPDARMLRRVAARLKVAPGRCVLVEDTLVHQKAAFGLGMRTVWMRRYLRGRPAAAAAPSPSPPASQSHLPPQPGERGAARRCRKPAYVGDRVVSLQALRRL